MGRRILVAFLGAVLVLPVAGCAHSHHHSHGDSHGTTVIHNHQAPKKTVIKHKTVIKKH